MSTTAADIDILSPERYRDGDPSTGGLPIEDFWRLQDEAPVYRHRIADPEMIDEIWVITRHADVLAIDRDATTYSSEDGPLTCRRFTPFEPACGGKRGLLTMDGADHRRNRLVVSRAMTPGVVATLEEHLRALARETIDRALEKGDINFVADVAVPLPSAAINDLLGVPDERRAQVLDWVNKLGSQSDPNYVTAPEEAVAAVHGLWAFGLELAELRRREPADDMMTTIVAAHTDGTLSDDELMSFVLTLAAAGGDTVRTALGQGMSLLLRHPEQMAWLRERKGDVPASALQEIVRYVSPLIHFNRRLTTDVTLHDVELKADESVCLHFAAANFDRSVFDAPERFDLARDPNPHLGWGRGPHICLGRHVALLEMKILFEELLQRTVDIEQTGPPIFARENFVHAMIELPVTLKPA